jgi:SOS-response transcriptional repressor LexA
MTGGQYWCYPPDLHKLIRLIAESDICPTYDQMQAHLGWKSKSGVWKAIDLLERMGYLRRFKQRRQAIEVTTPEYFVWDNRAKMLVPRPDPVTSSVEAAE